MGRCVRGVPRAFPGASIQAALALRQPPLAMPWRSLWLLLSTGSLSAAFSPTDAFGLTCANVWGGGRNSNYLSTFKSQEISHKSLHFRSRNKWTCHGPCVLVPPGQSPFSRGCTPVSVPPGRPHPLRRPAGPPKVLSSRPLGYVAGGIGRGPQLPANKDVKYNFRISLPK